MIHSLSSPLTADAPQHAHLRAALAAPDLQVGRIIFIESAQAGDPATLEKIAQSLVGDMDTPYAVDAAFPDGAVAVGFKLGVVDNESPSIREFCKLQGLDVSATKSVDVYVSEKLGQDGLEQAVRSTLFNTSAQMLLTSAPQFAHLRPEGVAEPMERFDLVSMSDDELTALGMAGGRGLDLTQMRAIRDIQAKSGDAPISDVLLEALDARWSDHCAHTTWKQYGNLLKKLKKASKATNNPNIVSMFDDNAGVWDFYNGQSISIKAETHNGPTAIAAYFGQLTKLGGVLRDILGTGLGSDPIGSFEYTATGIPGEPAVAPGRPSPRQIANETVRAISEYGNTFGVPMMFSRMAFHDNYKAKPFALGGAIGVMPTEFAHVHHAQPGDHVVLIGGLTGGEGLHGASASSAGAEMVESAVQIGTPLEEIKFRSAILEWRDEGCLSAITDLGAAGINSAGGEMGEACGIAINTALVPLKTSALPVWKILLSESQERMLMAVKPDALERAREIAGRHQVPFTVIGRFTDSGRYAVYHDAAQSEAALVAAETITGHEAGPDAVAFDVSYDLIDPPVDNIEVGQPPASDTPASWPELPATQDVLHKVLGHHEVQCQAWADDQYDSSVRGITVHGPSYGRKTQVNTYYWAGQVVDDCDGIALFTVDFTPELFEVHPVRAMRQSFVRSLLMQVLAGSKLGDVCLTDNFYTPHLAENSAEWLVAMVDELAVMVEQFGTPVISGKDSSAGSVNTPDGMVHVPPAVFFSALGKTESADNLLPELWQTPGNALVRVGLSTPSYAGTVASDVLGTPAEGTLDAIDTDAAKSFLAALESSRSEFDSATMLGAGGLASSLVRASLASGYGVSVDDSITDQELFEEHRVSALVELPLDEVSNLPAELNARVVGTISHDTGVTVRGENIVTSAALDAWRTSFETALHGSN